MKIFGNKIPSVCYPAGKIMFKVSCDCIRIVEMLLQLTLNMILSTYILFDLFGVLARGESDKLL